MRRKVCAWRYNVLTKEMLMHDGRSSHGCREAALLGNSQALTFKLNVLQGIYRFITQFRFAANAFAKVRLGLQPVCEP
jgi:hypothetical protein